MVPFRAKKVPGVWLALRAVVDSGQGDREGRLGALARAAQLVLGALCALAARAVGRAERDLEEGQECARLKKTMFYQHLCRVMSRAGNLGFLLGKLEILIVALSNSTYQSQRPRVQLPVGA